MFIIRMVNISILINILILLNLTNNSTFAISFDTWRAAKAYKNNDIDTAKNLYQKAIEKYPEESIALYNLGKIIYKEGDYKKAAGLFEKAAQITSKNQEKEQAYFDLGESNFKLKDYQKAIYAYENVLKINPNNEIARKRLEEAKKLLEQEKQEQNNDQKQENQDKNNQDQSQDKKEDQDNQKNNSEDQDTKDQNNSNSNNGDKQDNRKLITRLEPDKHYLIDVYQLSNPENLIIKYSYGTRQYWSGKIIIPASKIESLGKKFFNSTINLTLNPKKFKNHNYVTGFELPEVTVISNLGKSKMSITYNITVSDISSGKDMVLNF